MTPPSPTRSLRSVTDADLPQTDGDRESFVLRPTVWAGGASDVGLRHTPNQDALALAAGTAVDGSLIAVCCVSDGVSTSAHAEDASALAVETACSHVAEVLRANPLALDVAGTIIDAFAQANSHVTQAAGSAPAGTWACTLVVSVAWHNRVTVGSIGDSRCYWLPDEGTPRTLSTDDSVAQAQIDLGVTRERAETSSGAHAITKWLGPGSHTVRPSLQAVDITTPGWLLTCSDGLWNYASHAADMAEVVNSAVADSKTGDDDPAAWQVCAALVDWANERGGHDNIAVSLVRLKPT